MEQHVIVVGVETTTVRVVEELARSRTAAVVVVPPTADPMVVAELRARDVTIVEAARTDERVLREAGVHRARAVIVLGRDEVASTRTALAVEDADGRVPIVLEVVNPAFGSRLAPLLGDCTVLSPAQLEAPAFIGAAIGDGEVQALRLGGRDVVVGPSTSVAGQVLADLGDPVRGPLPDAHGASADVRPDDATAVVIGTQHRHHGRQVRTRGILGGAARLLDRRQRIVILLLLGVILASTAYFHSTAGKDLRIVTRLYDDDLATRVERRLQLGATRSVSMLTAPAFVAAALGRPRSTIVPVGRRVVLLTELQVEEDAGLVGVLPSQLSQGGDVRLLAVRREGGAWVWHEPDEAFGPGDRIAVAATRTGLGQLRLACRPPA